MRITKLLTLALVAGATALEHRPRRPGARPARSDRRRRRPASREPVTTRRPTPAARPRRHPRVSAEEQRAIEQRTRAILRDKGVTPGEAAGTSAIGAGLRPRDAVGRGTGDVTNSPDQRQIAVLNKDLRRPGVRHGRRHRLHLHPRGHRPLLQQPWHKDKQSTKYRNADPSGRQERAQHLAGRLQVPRHRHLPLGLRRNPSIDGIRVHYASLPGGTARQLQPR